MKLIYKAHTLHYKHVFKIAHGSRSFAPIVLTQLEHEGVIGYGEASLPLYFNETQDTVISFLDKAAKLLSTNKNPLQIESIINDIDAIAPGNTAAKASVDIALHDLVGKLKNKPNWQLFNCDKNKTPYTTFTIGIDEPEVLKQKIIEAEPYKNLKIKLNGTDDKLIVNTIRNATDKPIVIDVNQGWKDKHYALEMIEWLQNKNVLFIEQPFPIQNLDDANWLFERSTIPLYADENVQRYADIDKVKDCFHGINIKLMKCSGMYEANKMIQHARKLKLNVMIGCMSETSCAISAAAQLSPLVDHADLDGCLLMKDNLFDGIEYPDGKITLSEKLGNGAVPRGNLF